MFIKNKDSSHIKWICRCFLTCR